MQEPVHLKLKSDDCVLLNWNPKAGCPVPPWKVDNWSITGLGKWQPKRGTPFIIKRCRYKPAIIGHGFFPGGDIVANPHWQWLIPIEARVGSLENVLPVKALKLLGFELPWQFQGAMCRIDPVQGQAIIRIFDTIEGWASLRLQPRL